MPTRSEPESRHFLRYWKPEAVDFTVQLGGVFGHSAGNQHRWNRKEDVLWLVTVRDGDLQLCGRMVVWKVMSWDEVVAHFDRDDFWEADYHAVARRGTETSFADVSITSLTPRLRFLSSTGRDRLVRTGKGIPAQQLQSMRQLTAESVELLEQVWTKHSEMGGEDRQHTITGSTHGAGFGDPETNRKVERAAERFVTRWYQKQGWTVRPVGKERCGYDLECVAPTGMIEHAEVKGIADEAERFIIYRSGPEKAENDPAYRLFTVVNALDPKRRRLSRYTGEELRRHFNFVPKDYFATKKQ